MEEMCSTHFGKMITFCSKSIHTEKSGEGPDAENNKHVLYTETSSNITQKILTLIHMG